MKRMIMYGMLLVMVVSLVNTSMPIGEDSSRDITGTLKSQGKCIYGFVL
jgi:hypothetical protein